MELSRRIERLFEVPQWQNVILRQTGATEHAWGLEHREGAMVGTTLEPLATNFPNWETAR
jgi:hypothetical protein